VSRDEQRPDYGAGPRPSVRRNKKGGNRWLRTERARLRSIPQDEKMIRLPVIVQHQERPR
jgi:hypothetical protein